MVVGVFVYIEFLIGINVKFGLSQLMKESTLINILILIVGFGLYMAGLKPLRDVDGWNITTVAPYALIVFLPMLHMASIRRLLE